MPQQSERRQTAVVDSWTFVHFAAGLGARALGLGPKTAAGLAIAYEVLEQYLERDPNNIFATSGPENGVNVVSDLVAFAIGYQVGQ